MVFGIDPSRSGAEFDQPEYSGEVRSYIICSSQRSGSTLLADLLMRCGVMGVPHEYLGSDAHLPTLVERLGLKTADGRLDMQAYLSGITAIRTTPNGVFALKAHYYQVEKFIQSPAVRELFEHSELVYLRRRDLLGQAISLAMAQQTQKWSVRGKVERAAHYDQKRIWRALEHILWQESRWRLTFAMLEKRPLELDYEDFVADTHTACQTICRLIGVQTEFQFDKEVSDLLQQRSQINDEWRQRFLSEARQATSQSTYL